MPFFVNIKVVPLSGKAEFALDSSGGIICYLKSQPEKGKANRELIALLSKKLKIPQHDIVLVAGATSRKKRIKIERAMEYKEFLSIMGLEIQEGLFASGRKKMHEQH